MPKIFNTSWLAVIIATIVFFAIGWIWYGPIFGETWMAIEGITEAEAAARLEEMGMLVWFGAALSITIGQAIGLLMVLHYTGAKRLKACLTRAFWLVITIVAPILGYASVYGGYPMNGFLIDFGHMLIGYLAMSAVYAAFRGKDALDA